MIRSDQKEVQGARFVVSASDFFQNWSSSYKKLPS